MAYFFWDNQDGSRPFIVADVRMSSDKLLLLPADSRKPVVAVKPSDLTAERRAQLAEGTQTLANTYRTRALLLDDIARNLRNTT
jgi:hypothetical protein